MAGTRNGALKAHAERLGLTLEEYKTKVASGLKWCYRCQQWRVLADFGRDRHRSDGLAAQCMPCRTSIPSVEFTGSLSSSERRSMAAKNCWEHRREHFVPPLKGKKMSEAGRENMHRGIKAYYATHPGLRTGKRHTLATRQKISKISRERSPKGPVCPSYKDGRCAERRGLRETAEYKQWRYDVYFRDEFTCQVCGDRSGGNLNAHHIFPFAKYPEWRFEVMNGITVCESCHDRLHYKPDSIRNKQRRRNLIRSLKLLKRKGC